MKLNVTNAFLIVFLYSNWIRIIVLDLSSDKWKWLLGITNIFINNDNNTDDEDDGADDDDGYTLSYK